MSVVFWYIWFAASSLGLCRAFKMYHWLLTMWRDGDRTPVAASRQALKKLACIRSCRGVMRLLSRVNACIFNCCSVLPLVFIKDFRVDRKALGLIMGGGLLSDFISPLFSKYVPLKVHVKELFKGMAFLHRSDTPPMTAIQSRAYTKERDGVILLSSVSINRWREDSQTVWYSCSPPSLPPHHDFEQPRSLMDLTFTPQ